MSLYALATRHAVLTIMSVIAELTILFGVHPATFAQVGLYVIVIGTTGFVSGYHARRFVDAVDSITLDEQEEDDQ